MSVLGMASPLNLESYLSQVKQANPSLQAAKFSADSQKHRISPSSTWEDPFFAVGPDQIAFDGSGGTMLRFQLSQNIPFPGKLGAKGEAAEQRFNAAKAGADTTEREVTVIATQTFYQAYYNQKSIGLSQNLSSLLSGTVQSTKARYRTGDSSHHDWLLARVELKVLEVERLRLEREAHTLRALLNELRNEPPETPIEFASIDFNESELGEVTPDLTTQPELKINDAFVRAAEAEKRYAKLSLIPDLVLQGMAMKPTGMETMGTEKSNWGVMVGITIPVYFWRKQSELTQAAESSRNAALSERKALQNRLNSEITDAKEQFKTAKEIVTLYKQEVIPATDMALENAKSGYAAKRLPLTQFIETLKVKRTQELELLAANIDSRLSQIRLRELLSSPPKLRLAPMRPTLFGSQGMGAGAMGGMSSSSDTVNMGRGMSGSTRKSKEGGATPSSGASMPGMGGGM